MSAPTIRARSVLSSVALVVLLLVPADPAAAQRLGTPWDSVGRILGTAGADVGGAYRYAVPRTDLRVRVGDVTLEPALALGTWAGFGVMGPDTVVLGDLVVTSEELPAVLRRLTEDGIEVTAIHNHLAGEQPEVMYVHYFGRGPLFDLARKVRRAIGATGAPLPVAPSKPGPVTVDAARIYEALGTRGSASGSVAKVGFDQVPGDVTIGGERVPLGTGTAIAIQRVSDDRVVATGDFAVPAARVDALVDALTRNGITVHALHTHLIGELPRVYYMHFWADGPPTEVLRGLRAAVDAAR